MEHLVLKSLRKYLANKGAERLLSLVEDYSLSKELNNACFFLAAIPKSAGTCISKSLARYYGYSYVHLSDREGGCEFDIYRPRLIDVYNENVVVHQHTLATEGNIFYLNRYNIRPVVLVRNIYDVLVSFRDHMVNESMRWPFFSVDEQFLRLERRSQYDFIIKFVLPWLIHFYASWYTQSLVKQEIAALWCTYEEFVEDRVRLLERLINWFDPNGDVNGNVLARVAAEANGSIRFNVGERGRGRRAFDKEQRERICETVRFYKKVDFSLIGL